MPVVFIFGVVFSNALDTRQALPITLYAIRSDYDLEIDGIGDFRLPNTTEYLGSITINKDESYTFSKELCDSLIITDTNIYPKNKNSLTIDRMSFIITFYSYVKMGKQCELTTYHFLKPKPIREDDKIERKGYRIINGDKISYSGQWSRTTKTYFPNKNFFKCLYNQGYLIDAKIGSLYEKNSWTKEQKPYELIIALLERDQEDYIKGFDGKYYSVPKEIKKHVKEWQKKHPSPPIN